MGRRLVIAAATAAVLVSGCGSSHASRQAVRTYLKRVQRVESAMSKPLGNVTQAGSNFATGATGGTAFSRLALASTEGALSAAEHRISALRAQLAAIPAPASARRLRALLLELADRQLALSHEVGLMAAFLPAFDAQLKRLVPAAGALQGALSVSGRYTLAVLAAVNAQKAAALERFKAVVDAVAARLAKLKPPPSSLPAYGSQLASLRQMSATAGRLARAVRSGSGAGVAALLVAFDRAATLPQTTASQKARIGAVKRYDAQVTGIKRLVGQIDNERAKLDATLT